MGRCLYLVYIGVFYRWQVVWRVFQYGISGVVGMEYDWELIEFVEGLFEEVVCLMEDGHLVGVDAVGFFLNAAALAVFLGDVCGCLPAGRVLGLQGCVGFVGRLMGLLLVVAEVLSRESSGMELTRRVWLESGWGSCCRVSVGSRLGVGYGQCLAMGRSLSSMGMDGVVEVGFFLIGAMYGDLVEKMAVARMVCDGREAMFSRREVIRELHLVLAGSTDGGDDRVLCDVRRVGQEEVLSVDGLWFSTLLRLDMAGVEGGWRDRIGSGSSRRFSLGGV